MNTIAKENAILQIIKYLPSSLMVLLIISATTYISIQHNNDLKIKKLKIEKEYLTSNKERIKLHIDVLNRYIQQQLNDSEVQLKKELNEKINVAHNIALNIYNKNKNRLSKKEIIERIKYAIEPMRFDEGSGYFSIHTMDGINILNPAFRYLKGTSVLNRKDSMGHYPVQEAIKIAKTQDKGFFTWDYYKPNDTSKIYKKFGIVKKFAPYNLIITTAIFKEDFKKSLKKV
ncbi:cache domain-containing protein [Poseidonibacter antarcticus]|uniref:cache domain-containing protein n=1 Tax=Poseidonibacter antarcticus TaxID=2478538 RepID=UPI000EF44792|nr:cache domain-containing protein [Poseidonibacter antarcticus]